MKVFVTGIGGQLGYDVLNELKKRGLESVGSDIMEDAEIKLDITDKAAVETAFSQINPDAVIHCAAWTAVDAAEDEKNRAMVYAVNVTGTKNIAEACKDLGCKMVYISTDYVFNGQGTEPWQVDCKEYAPLNYYGQTKLEGELAVSEILDKFFIVRIAWVFGLNGNLELTASAEMRAGAFAEEFSALYDINGIDGFEKLNGVHQQAVSFLKKHKLYTKAEAEQASEELDQMITELRTVDMMEALFGKPEEIKPSMIEDKTAFNDYLNNLIESVGETEINSPKYLQLISSVFQIIHVKFPKNRSIRATARRWVIALGERNKNTGDYAKTHFTETYLLTVSSSAPKSSKRAKKSDNTAKADGEVPLDGKKNS